MRINQLGQNGFHEIAEVPVVKVGRQRLLDRQSRSQWNQISGSNKDITFNEKISITKDGMVIKDNISVTKDGIIVNDNISVTKAGISIKEGSIVFLKINKQGLIMNDGSNNRVLIGHK